MKKRIFSMLVVVAMLMGMVPATVLATSSELTSTLDLSSTSSASGDAYTWENNTLSITDDLTITVDSGYGLRLASGSTIDIAEGKTLTVNSSSSSPSAYAVSCSGALTITGGGSLIVKSSVIAVYGSAGVTIDGLASVNVYSSDNYAISSFYSSTQGSSIKNVPSATISSDSMYAIYDYKSFTIDNAIVTLSTPSSSGALYSPDLTLSNDAILTANQRLYCTGSVTINDTSALNGVHYYTSPSKGVTFYGNVMMDTSNLLSQDGTYCFTDGCTITLADGVVGTLYSKTMSTEYPIDNCASFTIGAGASLTMPKDYTSTTDFSKFSGAGTVIIDSVKYATDGGDAPDGRFELDASGVIVQGSGYVSSAASYENKTLTVTDDLFIDSESNGILSATDLTIDVASGKTLTIWGEDDGIVVDGNLTITGEGAVVIDCDDADISITGALTIDSGVTLTAKQQTVKASSATISGTYANGFLYVDKEGYDQEVIIYGAAEIDTSTIWSNTYVSFASNTASLTIESGCTLNAAYGVFNTQVYGDITNDGTFYFPAQYYNGVDTQPQDTTIFLAAGFVDGTGAIVLDGLYYDCDGTATDFGTMDFTVMSTTENAYFTWDADDEELTIKQALTINTSGDGIILPAGSSMVVNAPLNITAGDCGIDCDGNLTISGTDKVTIDAERYGVYAYGALTSTGVTWDIDSEDNMGIYTIGAVSIDSDAMVISCGKGYGIYVANGDLALTTAGTMDISAENEAIYSSCAGTTATFAGTGTITLITYDDTSMVGATIVVENGVTVTAVGGQIYASYFTNNGTTNAAVYAGSTTIYGAVTATDEMLDYGGNFSFASGATLTVPEGVTIDLRSYDLDYANATIINNGTIMLREIPSTYTCFSGTGSLSVNGTTISNDGDADYSQIYATLALGDLTANVSNDCYTWDVESATLTILQDVTITTSGNGIELFDEAVSIVLDANLTINTGNHGIWGDYDYDSATSGVTFTGDGTLTINAESDVMYVEGGSIAVEEGVTVIGDGDNGIYAYSGFDIDKATVTITTERYGIYVVSDDEDLTINNSTVTITSDRYGIYGSNDNDIFIQGKDTLVTIVADSSQGIYSDEGNVTITDATVHTTGEYGIEVGGTCLSKTPPSPPLAPTMTASGATITWSSTTPPSSQAAPKVSMPAMAI